MKPSGRYRVDEALQHPWITRNFDDPIPRTLFEESIFQSEIYNKMRRMCHTMLFLSITKDNKRFQIEKEEKKRVQDAENQEQERIRLERLAEEE